MARAIRGGLHSEQIQHLSLAAERGGRREVKAPRIQVRLKVVVRHEAVDVHRHIGRDVAVPTRRYVIAPDGGLGRGGAPVGDVGGGVLVGEAGPVRVLDGEEQTDGDVEVQGEDGEVYVLQGGLVGGDLGLFRLEESEVHYY